MPIIGAGMTKSEPRRPIYREYAAHFEKLLRMSTYPLAVKMLEKDADIPEMAKRPLKDFGYHLNTCQCLALSRRVGEMIAQKQEDMWCFEPALCFGFTGGNPAAYNEGLKFFLDGHTRYPGGAKDLVTGSRWAQSFPRFEAGRYSAVVSAPLSRAGFEPDLVLLYVNTAQLNQILAGIVYEWGENVSCEIDAHGGCVNYIIPAMKTGKFWISNPCYGDFSFAAAQPDELVFSAPITMVERLLTGIQGRLSATAKGIPINYQTEPEGLLPDSYGEIARIMKMHRSTG